MAVIINPLSRLICQGFTAALAMLLSLAPAQAQLVSPGETPVTIEQAIAQFSRACVDTLPEFTAAPAMLADQGFIQNPDTSTWFHQTLNLSIKLTPPLGGDQCSIVFASTADPDAIGLALVVVMGSTTVFLDPDSAITKGHREDGVRFFFDAGPLYEGDQYYHAVMITADQ